MSWNLEWFFDDMDGDNFSKLAREKKAPSREEWNWRRDAVAASIHKVSPTVCALQEVENRRVLYYLSRALERNHQLIYESAGVESSDYFTEQDVGFLFRAPANLLSMSVFAPPQAFQDNDQYYNVSKHLLGVFEFPLTPAAGARTSTVGSATSETVMVFNLHLRATADAAPLRVRQLRLVRHWIQQALRSGENVIVLGDFNTEQDGAPELVKKRNAQPLSFSAGSKELTDMEIAYGVESNDETLRLIDLHAFLPNSAYRTHLFLDKAFDRILVSPSLLEDAPGRPDLVFKSIEVRPDLCVRGNIDPDIQHWENYWSIPQSERDLSDHLPVIASFEIR